MNILKLAAFSKNGQGGNPAGVVFYDAFPSAEEMMGIAAEVGYSETAFLVKQNDAWRVRYFAPEIEIPFCGHATIALGAALGEKFGENTYKLILNDSEISVRAEKSVNGMSATLQSLPTKSEDAPKEYVEKILAGFGLTIEDLNPDFPVKFAYAGVGAKFLIIVLKSRKTLADMKYDFDLVKALMAEQKVITINLLWNESDSLFHSRNPFASGGVYEDPATGASAAAFAGYLRDIGWNGKNEFTVLQGEDMGMPSRLNVKFTPTKGKSVAVSGEVRHITEY
jgi:PhzF family phenazine biosynthesis protein